MDNPQPSPKCLLLKTYGCSSEAKWRWVTLLLNSITVAVVLLVVVLLFVLADSCHDTTIRAWLSSVS